MSAHSISRQRAVADDRLRLTGTPKQHDPAVANAQRVSYARPALGAGALDHVPQLISILWGSEMRFGVPCGQLGSYVVLVGESAEDLVPLQNPWHGV